MKCWFHSFNTALSDILANGGLKLHPHWSAGAFLLSLKLQYSPRWWITSYTLEVILMALWPWSPFFDQVHSKESRHWQLHIPHVSSPTSLLMLWHSLSPGPSNSLVIRPSMIHFVNVHTLCLLILRTQTRDEELDCIPGEIDRAVVRN